ncbi:hypothetical protein D3C77_488250 [compost metagenome]
MRLSANPSIEQLLLAAGIGLGVDPQRLHFGQVALGSAQLVALIGGVKAGQHITRLHLGADIDPAPGDAPGYSKAQGAFKSRLDTAGKTPETGLHLRLNDN